MLDGISAIVLVDKNESLHLGTMRVKPKHEADNVLFLLYNVYGLIFSYRLLTHFLHFVTIFLHLKKYTAHFSTAMHRTISPKVNVLSLGPRPNVNCSKLVSALRNPAGFKAHLYPISSQNYFMLENVTKM